ncbi:TATA box-binding protein-like protein 1 [Chelonus insularis]|uniref:TATA box-binding protein-like protein 1 n=1 Tax=Chelonus insularis TaxID=460826 RepID=UPI0015894F86|nr:TATA box-binding protein-like protein 1 [Chelonus insularis]
MESLKEKVDDVSINDDLRASEEVNLDIIVTSLTTSFRVGNIIDFKKVPPKYMVVLYCQTVQLKIDDCKIIIWHSGKSQCVGASSEDQALTAARKSIDILKSWGLDVTFSEFRVMSLFCSCLLPWRIQIEAMVTKYSNNFTCFIRRKSNYWMLNTTRARRFLAVYPSGYVRMSGLNIEGILSIVEEALPFFSEFRIEC